MIYIYDLIGAKSGCMYYNDAFCETLRKAGINATVVSNYEDNYSKLWLANMYKGIIPVKILKLCYNMFVLLFLLLKKKSKVVYLSYGTSIDAMFLTIGKYSNSIIVDIHEYVQLDQEKKKLQLNDKFNRIYRKIPLVIYHSPRTLNYLKRVVSENNMIYVPHFKYQFDQTYNLDKIDDRVKKTILKEKTNILFFGHFRESKGIKVLIEAIQDLAAQAANRYHFIFAGADPHKEFVGALEKLSQTRSISVVPRYIETEELNFLFDSCNAVILPYFEVSQSGVLETAVFFRKQLLLSDIQYFKEFINKQPSFGYTFINKSSKDLASLLSEINVKGLKHYSEQDLRNFYQLNEFESFIKEFNKHIS